MKTNEQLSEMAYKEVEDTAIEGREKAVEYFIKGYQVKEEEMKWIDCKDALPVDNTRCLVLVHRKNETQPSIEIAKKFEAVNLLMRNREMDDNFLIQGTVTHWQYLPQKPLMP